MMNRLSAIRVVAIGVLLLMAGCAGERGIQVVDAWSRATPPGVSVGVVYLTIRNRGTQPDELLSASTPRARSVELHATQTTSSVSSMQRQASVSVAPAAELRFEPGGLHFMLLGIDRPLQSGEAVLLVLQFAKAGSITVEARVKAPSE
jgi:copper(I)-binding protein